MSEVDDILAELGQLTPETAPSAPVAPVVEQPSEVDNILAELGLDTVQPERSPTQPATAPTTLAETMALNKPGEQLPLNAPPVDQEFGGRVTEEYRRSGEPLPAPATPLGQVVKRGAKDLALGVTGTVAGFGGALEAMGSTGDTQKQRSIEAGVPLLQKYGIDDTYLNEKGQLDIGKLRQKGREVGHEFTPLESAQIIDAIKRQYRVKKAPEEKVLTQFFKTAGKATTDYAKEMQEFYKVEDQNLLDEFLQGVGSSAVFLAPGMGIARGTSVLGTVAPRVAGWLGIAASSAAESMIEAGSTYQQVLEKTGNEAEARDAANKLFWADLATLMVTNKLGGLFDKIPFGVKQKLISMGMDGVEEGMQQVWSNVVSKDPVLQGVAKSAGFGTLIAGPTAVVTGVSEAVTPGRQAVAAEQDRMAGAERTQNERPTVQMPTEPSRRAVAKGKIADQQAPVPSGPTIETITPQQMADGIRTGDIQVDPDVQAEATDFAQWLLSQEQKRPMTPQEFVEWYKAQKGAIPSTKIQPKYNRPVPKGVTAPETSLARQNIEKMAEGAQQEQETQEEQAPYQITPEQQKVYDALDEETRGQIDNVPEYRKAKILSLSTEKNIPVNQFDFATGIPARNYIRNSVTAAMENPNKAILFFDLDKTKAMNEVLGHEATDDIFEAIGHYMRKHFGDVEFGRQGGEEFVAILNKGDAARAEEFFRDVNNNLTIYGEPVTITGAFSSGRDAAGKLKSASLVETAKAEEGGRGQLIVDSQQKGQYSIRANDRGPKEYERTYSRLAAAESLATLASEPDISAEKKAAYTQQARELRSEYESRKAAIDDRTRGREVLAPEVRNAIRGTVPGQRAGAKPDGAAGGQTTGQTGTETGKPAGATETGLEGEQGNPPAKPPSGQDTGQNQPPSQPGEQSGASEQSPVPGVSKEKLHDKILRKFQDKYRRLLTIQRELAPEGLSEYEDAYLQQELESGRVAHRIRGLERDYLDPLKEDMQKGDISAEELSDYLYAKHAQERNEYIKGIRPEMESGSGMSTEEANKILADFDAQGKTASLDKAAQKIWDMNQRSLQERYENGLLSEDEYKALDHYEHYVPLRGIGEEGAKSEAARAGKGESVRGKEYKRALGRESQARDILGYSILQAEESILRTERNTVGQAFLRFVENHPNSELWEVDETPQAPQYSKSKKRVVYGPEPGFQLRPDQFGVKVDGQQHTITIKDPALAKAMTGASPSQLNAGLRAMASLNRYLSMINTSLVPEFVATNFARDLQTAMANTLGENVSTKQALTTAKQIVKNIPAAVRGAWEYEKGQGKSKWGKYAEEMAEAGGRIGFYSMRDAETLQKKLIRDVNNLRPNAPNTVAKYAKSIGDFVMTVNGSIENATRLATYATLREQGVSADRAAQAAKNITVNFNKSGELGSAMNALYLFSNASIQGTARMARTLKSPRMRKIMTTVAAGSWAFAQLNRALGGKDDDDKDRYDKVPAWVKERNIVIMLPPKEGSDPNKEPERGVDYLTIPLPYGYNVFWVLGQAVDKAQHNHDETTKAVADFVSSIFNAFNPIGSAPTLAQLATPTAFRPLQDLSLNKNFMGGPIYPEQKYGTPKARSHTSFKTTSEASKKVAETLNKITGGTEYISGKVDLPPDVLEYVASFATGGMGATLDRIVSLGTKAATGQDIPVRNIPFARRFAGKIEPYQDVQSFYELLDKVDKIKKQAETVEESDPDSMPRINKKFGEDAVMFATAKKGTLGDIPTANDMRQTVKDMRSAIAKAETDGDAETAAELGRDLTKQIKQYNKQLRGVLGKGAPEETIGALKRGREMSNREEFNKILSSKSPEWKAKLRAVKYFDALSEDDKLAAGAELNAKIGEFRNALRDQKNKYRDKRAELEDQRRSRKVTEEQYQKKLAGLDKDEQEFKRLVVGQ